jgi:hypothetical protein
MKVGSGTVQGFFDKISAEYEIEEVDLLLSIRNFTRGRLELVNAIRALLSASEVLIVNQCGLDMRDEIIIRLSACQIE